MIINKFEPSSDRYRRLNKFIYEMYLDCMTNLTHLFQISIVSAYYGTQSSPSLDCTGLAENNYNCTDGSFLKRVEGSCQKQEKCSLDVFAIGNQSHCANVK